jgi:hypothetical protein
METSSYQKSFMKRICKFVDASSKSTRKSIAIYFAAPKFEFSLNQNPKPDNFYLKDVIVCAFDVQFPGIDIICGRCAQPYRSKGWSQERLVQDLDGVIYLLQKRYKCGCENGKVGISIVLDPNENVPDFIRCSYPIRTYHRSAVTEKFLNHIVNDATTGKSFHEIADGINTKRAEEYLRCHAMYASYAEYYANIESTKRSFFPSSMASTGEMVAVVNSSTDPDNVDNVATLYDTYPTFSAMDAVQGYNGDFNITPETIVEDFIGTRTILIIISYELSIISYY